MPKAERKRHDDDRIRLHFLGATRMVTGSLHFFEVTTGGETVRFFLDSGLNQENDSQNYQNRLPAGVKAEEVQFGIFSHAHIDHTGLFPKLVKDGFNGFAYCTPATRDLVGLLLPDSGHLHEEEAERINNRNAKRAALALAESKAPAGDKDKENAKGKRPGKPIKTGKGRSAQGTKAAAPVRKVEPLYTQADAEKSLFHIKTVEFNTAFQVAPGIVLKFTNASHLLGAGVVTLEFGTGSKKRRVVFTGDLGRPNMPVLQDIAPVPLADYLICEGTYGNKLHAQRDRLEAMEVAVKAALARAAKPGKRGAKNGAGVIVMAAFAIGRVQSLLHDLRALMAAGRLPDVPVFVDGRMANSATEIYRKHTALYNKACAKLAADGKDIFAPPRYTEVREWAQSTALDNPTSEPVIIISSSGMASGGRIMRHLEVRLPHEQNTFMFCGFQSLGTLGRQLVTPGVQTVKVAGKDVVVRATVEHMADYSGHGDYEDILRFMKGFTNKPKKVFLVHGEEESLEALKQRIEERLHWDVEVPKHRDHVDLE